MFLMCDNNETDDLRNQIAMISFSSLPGTKTAAECNPKEILLARETYEYACLLSVALCAALPEADRGDDQGTGFGLLYTIGFLPDFELQDFPGTWLKSKRVILIMPQYCQRRLCSFNFKG